MKKFAHHYLRPYPVVHAVGSHVYRLKLLKLMSQIHPVFHIVKLMPVPAAPIVGRHAKPLPPPKIADSKTHYEVEEVINSRLWRGKLQYLTRWKGYGHEENSWVAEKDLDAPELIAAYYRTHPNAPNCISAMAFKRMCFHTRPDRK